MHLHVLNLVAFFDLNDVVIDNREINSRFIKHNILQYQNELVY